MSGTAIRTDGERQSRVQTCHGKDWYAAGTRVHTTRPHHRLALLGNLPAQPRRLAPIALEQICNGGDRLRMAIWFGTDLWLLLSGREDKSVSYWLAFPLL